LLTTLEVANLLRVTPAAVRAWVAAGHLAAIRVGPRDRLRFEPDAIKSLLAGRGRAA
jgi:excisionase family DNA binding protein